jgi:hypothetical protein
MDPMTLIGSTSIHSTLLPENANNYEFPPSPVL